MRDAQRRGALGQFPWPCLWRTRERWVRLLPILSEVEADLPGSEPWRGAVLARGGALAAALAAADRHAARAAAASVVGLGEGSTPAGDDFLMGARHALWAADLPGRRWAPRLVSAAAARTTGASAAWHAAAARGEVGERWAELLGALAACDRDAALAASARVRSLGHTSGAFSLRGFREALGA